MSSITNTVATALRQVIGGQLKQSGHGAVWHDERTWQGMAAALIAALRGSVVLVDRVAYEELVRDATKARRARAHFEEYRARSAEQTMERIRVQPKEEK
jgi:hypothetical protein